LRSQFAISKTNLLTGWFWRWSHQLANGFEDDIELLPMLLIAPASYTGSPFVRVL
jgi:hypothetical protein